MDEQGRRQRVGVAYGVAAYSIWGGFPLFFSLFEAVPAWEVLLHRVVWACVFLIVLVTAMGRWAVLRAAFSARTQWARVAVCAVLIAVNWGVFIYAVTTQHALQASQGYFLTPLINVALGAWVLGERLYALQWGAIALAAAAIVMQVVWQGEVPWLGLVVAITFGVYGLVRKQIALDGLSGLFLETALLTPVALAVFVWQLERGVSHFTDSWWMAALLLGSGVLTAVPLLFFAEATRRLRLATVGLLLYLNPTVQFVIAVWVLGEPLLLPQLAGFVLIWLALVLYSVSALWQGRRHAVMRD